MDFVKLLQILEKVSEIVATLNAMGVKVNGTCDLPALLNLIKPNAGL